jgi:hypothetical protein
MLKPWPSALHEARMRPDLLFELVLARALARFDVTGEIPVHEHLEIIC